MHQIVVKQTVYTRNTSDNSHKMYNMQPICIV